MSFKDKPVIIFGASVLGKVALDLLEKEAIYPICFADNDKRKQEVPFHGYEVISFEDMIKYHPNVTIIIAADRYHDEIYKQIHPYYMDIYRIQHYRPSDQCYLDHLNVVVTTRCTLKCQQCSSLIPLYHYPKDCNTERAIKSITRLLKCVKGIGLVEVLGGEPFLNKDLSKIVDTLARSNKIKQIDIITNGTIIPRSMQRFKYPNVCVVVNHYGKKANILLTRLTEEGVNCRKNIHWKWADLGGFHCRNRTPEELEKLFSACHFHTCTELLNSELHRCPRSSHGSNLNLIPHRDYVKVLDTVNLEKKIKVLFNKKYIGACNYCDGSTQQTLTLEPAIQEN